VHVVTVEDKHDPAHDALFLKTREPHECYEHTKNTPVLNTTEP
jgi:hypothetical protein